MKKTQILSPEVIKQFEPATYERQSSRADGFDTLHKMSNQATKLCCGNHNHLIN